MFNWLSNVYDGLVDLLCQRLASNPRQGLR